MSIECTIECRLRQVIHIDDSQFGFMPGRGTVDAIFVTRQLCEKFRAKGKKLHWIFVDLEKAFDRVPRQVIVEALRHQAVPEMLINAVMATYTGAKTSVIVDGQKSEEFGVSVGVHQGSILSPLLFITVMQYVTESARHNDLMELLYADDLALCDETVTGVLAKYHKWKAAMERKGLKVSVKKTKGLTTNDSNSRPNVAAIDPCGVCRQRVGVNSIRCTACMCWVHKRCSKIRGSLNSARNFVCVSCAKPTDPVTTSEEDFGELGRVDKFVYLGHCVNASGGYEDAVSHRVQSAWYAFRRLRGTLVGKHGLSLRQRGFIYSRYVRPVLLYSCETWSLTTNLKLRLQSTERRMVRMMCGVRLVDRLPSEELRRRLGIQPDVIECLETSILRWFGHVVRRKDTHPIKAAHNFSVTGKRPPGRPKKTWDNAVRELLKARRLSEVDALNRVFWRSTIQGRPANLSQLGQGGNR